MGLFSGEEGDTTVSDPLVADASNTLGTRQ
jgi:hypothetical protein